MHLTDYLILAVIVLLAALAVRHIIKSRKSCCGDCASCRKSCSEQENRKGQ